MAEKGHKFFGNQWTTRIVNDSKKPLITGAKRTQDSAEAKKVENWLKGGATTYSYFERKAAASLSKRLEKPSSTKALKSIPSRLESLPYQSGPKNPRKIKSHVFDSDNLFINRKGETDYSNDPAVRAANRKR
jgi:hypothetical protein